MHILGKEGHDYKVSVVWLVLLFLFNFSTKQACGCYSLFDIQSQIISHGCGMEIFWNSIMNAIKSIEHLYQVNKAPSHVS